MSSTSSKTMKRRGMISPGTTGEVVVSGLVAPAVALDDYDGLRHLGVVGAVGNVANLLTALLLLPAGLRLARAWRSD
jgi:hypothetical protein